MVIRFTSNGFPDSTFGQYGITTAFIDSEFDFINAIALQSDGKIIAAGEDGSPWPNIEVKGGIMRFNTDGTLDNTFGINGKVSTTIDGNGNAINSVAIQQNGKLVIAQQYSNINATDYAVSRLLTNGSVDKQFGNNGSNIINLGANDECTSILIYPDSKILGSGYSYLSGKFDRLYLLRYNGDPITQITKATIIRWIKNHILHWQLQGVNNDDVKNYVVETNKGQSIKLIAENSYDVTKLLAVNGKHLTIRIKAVLKDGSVVYSDWITDATTPTIAIYPNPVKDVLNITGLPNTKTIINITNRNGNVLITSAATSSSENINVSALKSGVYYVSVLVDGKLQTLQFIKE